MTIITLLETNNIIIQRLTESSDVMLSGVANWPIMSSYIFSSMISYGSIYIITTKNVVNPLTTKPCRYLFFFGDGISIIPSSNELIPMIGLPNGALFGSSEYIGPSLPGIFNDTITPFIAKEIHQVSIISGGSLYSINDLIIVPGKTFTIGILKVTNVDDSGNILDVSILVPGTYIDITNISTPIQYSIGSARFNILFSNVSLQPVSSGYEIDEINLVLYGAGYYVNQFITFNGGTVSYPIIRVISIDSNGGIGTFELLSRGIYTVSPNDLNNIPATYFMEGFVDTTNAIFSITLRPLTRPLYNPQTLLSIDIHSSGSKYVAPSLNVISGGSYTSPAIIAINAIVDNVLSDISLIDGGMYTSLPPLPAKSKTGDATFSFSTVENNLSTILYQAFEININNAGNNYEENLIITFSDGIFTIPCIIRIDEVSSTGSILTFSVLNFGSFSILPYDISNIHVNVGPATFSGSFIPIPPNYSNVYLQQLITSQTPTDGSGNIPPDNGLGLSVPYNSPLFLNELGESLNVISFCAQWTDVFQYFSSNITITQASKCSESLYFYKSLDQLTAEDMSIILDSNPNMLQYFISHQQNISPYAHFAISRNPNIISLLANHSLLTHSMIETALSNNGALLKYFINNPKLSNDLIMLALSNNGNAIQFVSSYINLTLDMIITAINQSPSSLKYIINNPKITHQMISRILTNNPDQIPYVVDSIKLTTEIIEDILSQDGNSIQYIVNSTNQILLTPKLMRMVVSQNQTNLQYIAYNANLPSDLITLAQQLGYL